MTKMTEEEIKVKKNANFKRNKTLKFDSDTIFMVMLVEDKPLVQKPAKDGKGTYMSLDGWYLIYNPDDDLVSFFQKWMLKHNKAKDEYVQYTLVRYEDFKDSFDPMYQEWQEPRKSDEYPPTADEYSANKHTIGFYEDIGREVNQTKLDVGTEKKKKGDKKKMSEKRESKEDYYRRVLLSEGLDPNEIEEKVVNQIAKMKGLINEETALFIMCQERGVEEKELNNEEENEEEESADSSTTMKFLKALAGNLLENTNLLKSIESGIRGLNEYLNTLTSGETIGLKDLLSPSQLEKVENPVIEEEAPMKKSTKKNIPKKSSEKSE